MRTLANIATLLAAVAGILALSVASAQRDQSRLLEDFTSEKRDQVHHAAEALGSRVRALDQDMRMLGDLVQRSSADGGAESEPAAERRVWASAFQALASVVVPYRSIALFRPDGSVEVSSADPSENPATREALLAQSQLVAASVRAARAPMLSKSAARVGDRSFFLYGEPVEGWGPIVVAVDVALFLAPASPLPAPPSRAFVTDPGGVVWEGCGSPAGCRAMSEADVPSVVRHAASGVSEIGARGARSLDVGGGAVLRVREAVEHPTGAWSVTWLVSSEAIVARERSLLLRLLVTSLAAAMTVAGVGLAILRQQRNAFALEGRLQYAQALATARETSEAIVENAPLGVLGIGQDGRIALVNRFLGDRLGPIRVGAPFDEAFTGEGLAWMRELGPLLLAGRANDAGARGLAQDGAAYRDVRPVTPGAPPFDVRIVPVRSAALGIQTFALFEDRTTIRDLENQLVRAEKLITVGVLSAGIAHEIGTPLAVIRGRAEQVLRHVGAGPQADDLRVVIKHIDGISTTIRQLLDFSRRQAIEQRAVAIGPVVEKARELLEWKLSARKVTIEIDVAEDLPALAADPDQLEQVLVNLLLNASDASDPGGVVRVLARRFAVLGAAGEVRVALHVIDTGCGIAPEHVHSVFDPFFTTKKRGEGTGLGLSIAASVVRNHGGEIDLESAPGKGTTVTVLWPAISDREKSRG